MTEEIPYLTTREAARRAGRSVRTIRRWHRAGLPALYSYTGNLYREDHVLHWLRTKTLRNPVHQYRLRRARTGDTPTHPRD